MFPGMCLKLLKPVLGVFFAVSVRILFFSFLSCNNVQDDEGNMIQKIREKGTLTVKIRRLISFSYSSRLGLESTVMISIAT